MERSATVCVAGGGTLIGQALLRQLAREGHAHVVGGAGEPDWSDRGAVDRFFDRTRPVYVVVAAGPSGGIRANQTRPATLMRENLLAVCHILDAAHRHGVRRLLYLGSSCSYPRDTRQPMRVDALLDGAPEPTNAAYAMAKRAGIQLCRAYRAEHGLDAVVGIPADVYGPGDDFDPEGAHVVPALVRKLDQARRRGEPAVTLWGSGAPRREFLFADDLAEACLVVLRAWTDPAPVNLGGGTVCSIRDLAREVAAVVGYAGEIRFDATRPDGMPVKTLEAAPLAALGWRPRTALRAGLAATHAWFVAHVAGREADRAA
jgi:GDP-L-fucose synthase